MVHIGLVKTQNCFQKRRSLALAWPCVLPKEQGDSATHAHLDQRTVDVSHAPCGRLGSRKLGPPWLFGYLVLVVLDNFDN